MHDDVLRDLIERYQQGRCTPEEEQRLRAWYDALGQERQLRLTPDEQAAAGEQLWQRLAARTIEQPPVWRVWRVEPLRWASAAAVLIGLLLGLGYYLRPQETPLAATAPATAPVAPAAWLRQTNHGAAPVRIALADGSVVMLAPASTLHYPRRFGPGRREVTLEGEAFFEVHHDDNQAHQFRVLTDKVMTTVLGTSFTVRAYPGQAQGEVEVRTGRVRVTPRQAAARPSAAPRPADVVVAANQRATYLPARQELRRELVARPVQLHPQSFDFDERPVTEVLQALQKAYGVPIEHDAAALAHCTVTLSLERQPTLASKLAILCEALGASYDEADGRIRFHSPGCTVAR